MYSNRPVNTNKMYVPDLNYNKLIKICFGVLVFGFIYGFILFPNLIKMAIKHQKQLEPGSKTRVEMYMVIPFPIEFSIYLMNLTNPDEVQGGRMPIVQEIGPYYFDEYKSKYDPEDDANEDTLTFTLRNKFIFKPDKTLPLTGNEMITIPHMVVMAAMIMTSRNQAPLLPTAIDGINEVFNHPTTPFMTATAWDLLFGGIPINCDHDEFHAQAVCNALEESLGETAVINDTHLSFSLFKAQNNTDAGRFKVYRGIKNVEDVGKIKEFNYETELVYYYGEECNEIKGTDGLYFKPFIHKREQIWAYSSNICKSMAINYKRKSSYKGVATHRYETRFENKPDCFCRDSDPDLCPPEGTMDLSACLEAPIIGSKPHFYESDPNLLDEIKGLSPDEDKHDLQLDFELFVGNPLRARQRLMFSIDMEPIEKFAPMKDLRKAILPVFWVEEAINLNSTFVNLFKGLHIIQHASAWIKWISLIVGLIGIPTCIFLLLNQNLVQHMHASSATSASIQSQLNKVNKISDNYRTTS